MIASVFSLGVATGLGVAIPLGAIGVLLLREGMANGLRRGLTGASAVASVDLLYGIAAVVAGSLISEVLSGHERIVRICGAIVLVIVAIRGILAQRRNPELNASLDVPHTRIFLRFAGLTAINPLTAVYFTVVAAGFTSVINTWTDASAFVVGIFVGSLMWQCVIVIVGSAVGSRMSNRWKALTTYVGYGIVLILALGLLIHD